MPYNFLPGMHLKESIGSTLKRWLKAWVQDINVSSLTASKLVKTDASKNLATVSAAAALTTALSPITWTAPSSADYAIQALTTPGYGFATSDEGNTVLKVLDNTQQRLNELETKLKAHGLIS